MRILVVNNMVPFVRGGAEELADHLVRHLRRAGHDADLICVGHSHWQTERRINGVHVVNPGSVGNPKGSITAKYAILEAEKSGYQVHMRQVAFDAQAVLKQLDEVRHPAPAYIRLFYGEGFKGAN